MEFRHLVYFVTIVEQSTYTRAATVLHVSQPSLSAAIKKLENEVGLTLIKRNTRSLEVTSEGKILYQEAKKLLNHYQHVSKEMIRLKEQGPLELTIGLIESSNFWVPKILKQFQKEYQDAHIKLLEILSLTDVEKALTNFDIHLAITNQNLNNDAIETLPIYEEKLVAVLPQGHNLQDHTELTIYDLKDETFIICKEGFQTREDILYAFAKSGIQPMIQFEIERFETACRLVIEGLGITVVPENYVKNTVHSDYHIKHINDSHLSRSVYLAYEKNRYLPPIVLKFIGLVEEFFKQ
ncbi:LysR family transcriptional regulator [Virgibacillus sp. AGTR]|uniref:LysR family transcriptional regulator n=1 Tax=unclassified Virgibacillus TaxID=2620237 RepID=UPI000EF47673|nr:MULTISPECIES: LysR family transcriptional regulator [unclassified Virgibacillus]MCC2248554.1 LysR family transcriptional regulator [Virgibacillus sp. AGTR]MDY7043244.1 LysR family transcriptional regulator [Virgibacillus sp. M23]QRZ18275.1 LysR family transcriptional regulator [Virgibacillus sp. AGTR]